MTERPRSHDATHTEAAPDGPRYRITAVTPWPSEGLSVLPLALLHHYLDGHEMQAAALADLLSAWGARVVSAIDLPARGEVSIVWCGHHYDLTLEPVADGASSSTVSVRAPP